MLPWKFHVPQRTMAVMIRCSKCGKKHARNKQRYCLECHAKAMRKWRKANPLQGEARKRANARSYAKVYLSRGKLERKPCKICGAKAQMHHEDYAKPLEVTWLCREHHLELHRN